MTQFKQQSEQLARVRAENPSPLPPNEWGGRLRVKRFDLTLDASFSDGERLELAVLEPGQVLLMFGFSDFPDLDDSVSLGFVPLDDVWDTSNSDALVESTSVEANFQLQAARPPFEPARRSALVLTADPESAGSDSIGSTITLRGFIVYADNT